ncbi:MAG: hypothetical protein ABEJ57_03835 [Halobacteriaceae archaeon]
MDPVGETSPDTMDDHSTRRYVLRTGAAVAGLVLGAGTPGKGDERGNGREFGRVYGNDSRWRTLVVRPFEARADPDDALYFLHDGTAPIVANDAASADQLSPFVAGATAGDRDLTGGHWTTYSAEVTDVDAFNADAPLTSEAAVLAADYITVTLGTPGFGPPNFFLCPLNGRA